MWPKAFLYGLLFLLFACQKVDDNLPNIPLLPNQAPEGYVLPNYPEGNEFSADRFNLGKALFYDPILSEDSTKSCASCHKPEYAFAEPKTFSEGVKNRLGNRNTPTLTNVAYNPYFTFEGGVPTLEMQVLIPLQEHNELNFNIVDAAEKLKKHSRYVDLAIAAYDQPPSPYVITRALACFERSLISFNSMYDDFIKNKTSLNPDALAGYSLFFSDKTGCFNCHSGDHFTSFEFENNGLYESYPDSGRLRLTGNIEDKDLFKVPTLRNVALTGPYMHDGSFKSLIEVINHYNSGGKQNPNKSKFIKPLGLTEKEKLQLVEFLNSLTDSQFINNPFLKP